MALSNTAFGLGSTITQVNVTGIAPEVLAALIRQHEDYSETQKKLIARLEKDLEATHNDITAALKILGESNVPAEHLSAKLVEVVERLRTPLEIAAPQSGDAPEIAALRGEAQEAYDARDFAKADALLAEVETEQRRALGRFAVKAAETSAKRGEIAVTRLRYVEAAVHFANAAALVAPFDTEQQWRFLVGQAFALYKQGDEFGDNAALIEAIDVYRCCLALATRSERPLEWARTQVNLGAALARLGGRESGTARLEEAVAAFREALQEYTRERVPLDWAATQMNLGTALATLGVRESGTVRLEEAVTAFREALQENTRERVPLDWAMTQMNLGNALARLGARESGTARLEEAVAAYCEALQESTRKRVPLDWATTQVNLGTALQTLGERESGTARLEEAVAAYRAALQEYTRERVPLYWATTQMNLGNALSTLGERESGTARLEEAVAAYHEALKENTRERVPLEWAKTQMNSATRSKRSASGRAGRRG